MPVDPSPALQPRSTSADCAPPWDRVDKAVIYASEALRIARFVREYPSIETGGELFGYWTNSGAPVVSYAVGPGRGSVHRDMSFRQNADWLHGLGTDLYDRHALQHIGAWHSHHRLGLNEPSLLDIRTVVRGIEERSKFLLMIATLDTPKSPVVQNYYLVGRTGKYRPLRLRSLPGESPFRTRLGEPGEESVQDHAAIVPWCSGELLRLRRRPLVRSSAASNGERQPKSSPANAPSKGGDVRSKTARRFQCRPIAPTQGKLPPPSRRQEERAQDCLQVEFHGGQIVVNREVRAQVNELGKPQDFALAKRKPPSNRPDSG